MQCIAADEDDETDDQLVLRWCTGIPKFRYCFPVDLLNANDGCNGHDSEYTCGSSMLGFIQNCQWDESIGNHGACQYSGGLNADPDAATCPSCEPFTKQQACDALRGECAIVLDTAQRMSMKALSTDADGDLVHSEAAVLGSGGLFSEPQSSRVEWIPEPSTTEPFSTRTKNARRYISKALSLCGAGDDTLDDRDPGEPPVPQGWTKLCDGEANFTEPCELDEISYRNDRTEAQEYEKPTLPAGTCSMDTIGERLEAVKSACEHEYFPHPTIRRYDNKTDCLDYRHLARALRDDEFIESCSIACASVFIPFLVDCDVVLNALADHGEEYLGPGKSLFPKKVNVLAPIGSLCEDPTPRNCSEAVYDGGFDFTLFDGERRETLPEYAGRLLRIAVAVVVKGMKRGEVMVAYVTTSAAFLAWVCNIIAMASWYNMKKSIKWIRIGWACAFIAPFLITTYPMKTFIDLTEANDVVLAFKDTLNQHFLDEAVRAADYADARANASYIYTTDKLEQAQVDMQNQQIATQRDFERFGAEMEDYNEETHQAIMGSINSQSEAISMQMAATEAAYGEAREDADAEVAEREEQTSGMSSTINGFVQQGYDALQYTCDLLDEAADFVGEANQIDNIVPWDTIKDVDDFLQSVPVEIGFHTPAVDLGCIPQICINWPWPCSCSSCTPRMCFGLPSIGFSIPMPWWPIVWPMQQLFSIVPTEEVIDDVIVDVKCAFI